jgi:uncharacterized protein YjbI with pentapeptide repeats
MHSITVGVMADQIHLGKFLEGIDNWNAWRKKNPGIEPDLSNAKLSGAHSSAVSNMRTEGFNLRKANLWNADLSGAGLIWADLREAVLIQAKFRGTWLIGANIENANLLNADLKGSNLTNANLEGANVSGVKYNRWGKYRGIRTATCFGSPRFKRFAQDNDFIEELKGESRSGRFLYWLWLVSTDCGRSFWPLFLWLFFVCFVFGAAYSDYGIPACLSWLPTPLQDLLITIDPRIEFKHTPSWFSPYYFSVVTLTTLGFGDITPINTAGEIFAAIEVLMGYVILGLLISVLANKVARRS